MSNARPWWLRKRLLLPVAALLLFLLVVWYSAVTSDDSKIMVYNETAVPIRQVTIQACGQSFAVPVIEPDESVRFDLAPTGGMSNVVFSVAGTTNWHSASRYLAPRGGHRLRFHLRPGGYLDVRHYRSWFQQYVMGKPAIAANQ